jgi:hypothetical protein
VIVEMGTATKVITNIIQRTGEMGTSLVGKIIGAVSLDDLK